MPLLRIPRSTSRTRRPVVLAALGLLSLLGLLVQNAVASHSHSHHHAVAEASDARVFAEDAVEEHEHHEHDHHHSGDPETDLRTLGHTHVGGPSPGLPPALWFLADAPEGVLPNPPSNDRPPGDSPPDTPFRPPIA